MSHVRNRWTLKHAFHFNKQLFEPGKWKSKKQFFVGPITSWTVKINVLFFSAFSQITFSTKRCYHYSSKKYILHSNINSTLLLHYVANANVKIQRLFFLSLFNHHHHSHFIVFEFFSRIKVWSSIWSTLLYICICICVC